MTDTGRFPHPVYAETVLAPLFEGVKAHHAADMAAINRAHLVMLGETGILTRAQTRALARALRDIEAEVVVAALTYTGEHEDYFFLVEAELKHRLGDLGGMLHTARSRNDMDHTMFRRALLRHGQALLAALHALTGALNSYGCIAAVDYITALYSAIRLAVLHLGRVVQDMAFWSAFEVGQLRVPDSLVQISSIMPQKRNPVPIEHLRHLCSVTAGRCEMVVGTMHNTPFTDMNDSEGAVQEAGYAAFESGGRALRLMAALLPACAIDGARVRANADAACITVTELADTLVRDAGLSFRQAHEIAARTARAAIAARQPLSAAHPAFAAAFEAETGRAAGLDAAAFAAAVAPESFVARRDRPGGPAPAALDAAFAHYRDTLAAQQAAATRRDARAQDGANKLDAAFAALLED